MSAQKVRKHLQKKKQDPYFKKLYEIEEQKLDIVKRIIDYRIKQNISQKDLAKRVGVSQQHISKIETGEFSNVTTLEKVLLAIGYTVQLKIVQLKPEVARRVQKTLRSHKNRKAA